MPKILENILSGAGTVLELFPKEIEADQSHKTDSQWLANDLEEVGADFNEVLGAESKIHEQEYSQGQKPDACKAEGAGCTSY